MDNYGFLQVIRYNLNDGLKIKNKWFIFLAYIINYCNKFYILSRIINPG